MHRYETESGLPRVRFECRTLADAARIRERYVDCCVAADDGRSKTVIVSGDALDSWLREMEQIANSKPPMTYSQLPLSRSESRRIDFSRTNTFHARSCKGIAAEHDVGDWLAYYDHTLTVDEHKEIYAHAGTNKRESISLRQMADVIR